MYAVVFFTVNTTHLHIFCVSGFSHFLIASRPSTFFPLVSSSHWAAVACHPSPFSFLSVSPCLPALPFRSPVSFFLGSRPADSMWRQAGAHKVWAHFHTWPCESIQHLPITLLSLCASFLFLFVRSHLCDFTSLCLFVLLGLIFPLSLSFPSSRPVLSAPSHLALLTCFASSSPLSPSLLTPPSFLLPFFLPLCKLPSFPPLPLSSPLPLRVMEVCFYMKWQCKELYKGYSGFLYDTAILLITLMLSLTHTHTHAHTHTHTHMQTYFLPGHFAASWDT